MSENDDPNIKKRVINAAKMSQDPEDRLWGAIYVLIAIALLSAVVTAYYAERTIDFHVTDREGGFQRGAIDCLSVVIDNDRDFELPVYCTKPEVFAYFPPEICEVYLRDEDSCGEKWRSS